MYKANKIKLFSVDEADIWAHYSLEECASEYETWCLSNSVDFDRDGKRDMKDEETDKMRLVDDNGKFISSFRDALESPDCISGFFATSEY